MKSYKIFIITFHHLQSFYPFSIHVKTQTLPKFEAKSVLKQRKKIILRIKKWTIGRADFGKAEVNQSEHNAAQVRKSE